MRTPIVTTVAAVCAALTAAACSSSDTGESTPADASQSPIDASQSPIDASQSPIDAAKPQGSMTDAPAVGSGDAQVCRPKFASGLNVAWFNFAKDVPNPPLTEFDQLFQNTFNAGGRVVRWWFHTNGTATPGYQAAGDPQPGMAKPISASNVTDVKSILDTAYADHVMVTISLWSFDMLQGSEGIPADTLADNLALLTQDANRQSYIDNVLTPLATALKGYHGLYAWEIFNEAEGMTTQHGWTTGGADGGPPLRVDESVIQKNVNWFSDAIHNADPSALVTTGAWQFTVNAATAGAGFTNAYSNAALLAAGGDGGTPGRANGTLDFYEDHWYDNWNGATTVSPFAHPAAYWDLDKPVVIGEFWPIASNGVAAADLYTTLYTNGYAGGWAWQYATSDDPDASTAWPAEQQPLETLFAAHAADIECPGDPAHEGPDAAACTTALSDLSDGGGQLLYGFDNGTITGWSAQAMDSVDSGLVATIGDTLSDGKTCPGALTVTVPFTTYGATENADVQIGLGGVDWSNRSTLHFWVKLTTASYPAISGVQAFVQSGPGYANYTSEFVTSIALADGGWHPIAIDLKNLANDGYTNVPDGGALGVIDGIGVQVVAQTSAPAGGPSAPSAATLAVDDIWVE
jgi:hypothetical protein